jgi:hypothetical protein
MRSIAAPFETAKVQVPSEDLGAWNAPFDLRAIVTGSWVFVANAKGWTVVSIKDDWATIFPPTGTKQRLVTGL